jgi:2-polyprenyl-3-methyl-5-hydroxy-6-metoxy-1,4-benzoquinol methylase
MTTPASYWDEHASADVSAVAERTRAQRPVPRTLAGRCLNALAPARVYSYAVEDAPKLRWLERALAGTGPLTLDVGVRTGSNAAFFSAHGKRCFGLDLAQAYVDHCKAERLIEDGAVCNVESDEIPTPASFDASLPAGYDLVFFGEIIEHLLDGAAVIRKLAGIVRPGGHLVITTPNLASLVNRVRLLFGRDLDPLTIDRGEVGNQHIRVFTLRLLTKMCAEAGLTVDLAGGDGLPVAVSRHFDAGGEPVYFSIPLPASMSHGIYVRARRS